MQVADFGLAQWAGPDGDTARTDTVTNHLWLAPEVLQKTEADSREQQRQQQGSEPGRYMVSKAADVYSYGCVLLEVLTGRMPFETDSVNRLQLKAVSVCVEAGRECVTAFRAQALAALVQQLLCKLQLADRASTYLACHPRFPSAALSSNRL